MDIPIAVAGCPPDAFSAMGNYGEIHYMIGSIVEIHNYEWWIKRIEYSFKLYDVVRIDHFRAFDEYYSIPYGDRNSYEWILEKRTRNRII